MSDARRRRKLIRCVRYEMRLHSHASRKLAFLPSLTRRLRGPARVVWPVIDAFGHHGVI